MANKVSGAARAEMTMRLFNRLQQYDRMAQRCRILFEDKNEKYGDAFATGGITGVSDEIVGISRRLHNAVKANAITCLEDLPDLYTENGEERDLEDLRAETGLLRREERDAILYEAFRDLANYGLMGMCLLEDNNINGRIG